MEPVKARETVSAVGKVLTGLLVGATAVPRIRSDHWSARVWEFPRLQLAGLGGLTGAFLAVGRSQPLWWIALAGATTWQVWRAFPYLPGPGREVKTARGDGDAFSVVVANVYQPNRRFDELDTILRQEKPDVVVCQETDAWWADRLESLRDLYPHMVRCALPNTYGVVLLSRHPIVHQDTKYLVEKDVPSIHAILRLPSGRLLAFYALHPKPPAPGHGVISTERDVELLRVGRTVRERTMPVVVAGDFNDVSWSRTARRFRALGRLLDPRKGRGPLPTFPAGSRLFSVPLDQVFVSEEFTLRSLRRLPKFGSDHRPLLAELCLEEQPVRKFPLASEAHGVLQEKRAELAEERARADAVREAPMRPE